MIGANSDVVRQFDVFPHPTPKRAIYPFLVVMQHDALPAASEAIVAPLCKTEQQAVSRLYPLLKVEGQWLMLLAPAMGRIPFRLLRTPVGNLGSSRERIIAAIDLVFAGS